MNDYGLIVIGGSWGGMAAVSRLFRTLPEELDGQERLYRKVR